MARLTPQEAAEKWGRRLKASTPDMQAGIRRVTEAPGVAAAAQANTMLANLQESVTSGKWANKVRGVSLQDWQNAALNKGVGRVAAGVDGAGSKMVGAMTNVLADVDATLAEVNRTPRGDLATNINRATTFMQGMAARGKARNR